VCVCLSVMAYEQLNGLSWFLVGGSGLLSRKATLY